MKRMVFSRVIIIITVLYTLSSCNPHNINDNIPKPAETSTSDSNDQGSEDGNSPYLPSPPKWVQDAYIKASNAEAGDHFGNSVDIDQNTIVVGAYFESSAQTSITNTDGTPTPTTDDDSSSNAGAVYVFRKDENGNWYQDAYLKASNAETGDSFGYSVAISGNTIVVGAPYEDSTSTSIINADDSQPTGSDSSTNNDCGAVYVFTTDENGNWYQDAYLKASNIEADDLFGRSVAISGNTIVVGATGEDSNQTTITNTDGTASTDNSLSNSGAVYVFKKDINGDWYQDAYIKPTNPDSYDYFGYALAIDGDTIVVGAYNEDNSSTTIVNTDNASITDDNGATGSGAVYVFRSDNNGDWYQDAYLKPSNGEDYDFFGWSVAISGDTIAVGAKGESSNQTTITNIDGVASSDNSEDSSGAVYIFKRDANGDWYQDAYIKASNAEGGDNFGDSVAIDGDILVVGAINEDSNATTIENTDGETIGVDNDSTDNYGAVYVFKRDSDGNWYQDAYIKASNGDPDDLFGSPVVISGTTIVVGTCQEDSNIYTIINDDGLPTSSSDNNDASDSGAVYVFTIK